MSQAQCRRPDFRVPLQRLRCLSGVSGSGKSTLLDNVVSRVSSRNVSNRRGSRRIGEIHSDLTFADIVLVGPVAGQPHTAANPALYADAWEPIRELFASTPAAQEAGYSSSVFI